MSLSVPGASDFNLWRNQRARLVVISKTSRARGAAEEPRAAELRRGFCPAPKGPAEHHPSPAALLSSRIWQKGSGDRAEPMCWAPGGEWSQCPKKGQELGQAQESWSRDKLAGRTARTQFQLLVLSPYPHESPAWKVQVHPGGVSPSPALPSAAAKLLAGTVTLPNPASLPCWHSLTPAFLQPFSPD